MNRSAADDERILLIDNSNTRTKMLLSCGGVLCGPVRSLPTTAISRDHVQELVAGWHFTRVVLCSVVPDTAAALRAAFTCPIQEISAALCPRLLRFYRQPETPGADRLANAAAAATGPLPCIAADLGTACTFDAVGVRDGAPALLGGCIAPGLHSLSVALTGATARLRNLPIVSSTGPRPPILGQNTQEALAGGSLYGFRGMVCGILREMIAALPTPPHILLTGGDAALCADLPLADLHTDPMLTFRGIQLLAAGCGIPRGTKSLEPKSPEPAAPERQTGHETAQGRPPHRPDSA